MAVNLRSLFAGREKRQGLANPPLRRIKRSAVKREIELDSDAPRAFSASDPRLSLELDRPLIELVS
jgi:hypothetical protein